eukprot:1158372-Pelagomonas_calceolata.AAC.3
MKAKTFIRCMQITQAKNEHFHVNKSISTMFERFQEEVVTLAARLAPIPFIPLPPGANPASIPLPVGSPGLALRPASIS